MVARAGVYRSGPSLSLMKAPGSRRIEEIGPPRGGVAPPCPVPCASPSRDAGRAYGTVRLALKGMGAAEPHSRVTGARKALVDKSSGGADGWRLDPLLCARLELRSRRQSFGFLPKVAKISFQTSQLPLGQHWTKVRKASFRQRASYRCTCTSEPVPR
jgi:hypothetical protein